MPTNISAATSANEAPFGKDSFILLHNDDGLAQERKKGANRRRQQ